PVFHTALLRTFIHGFHEGPSVGSEFVFVPTHGIEDCEEKCAVVLLRRRRLRVRCSGAVVVLRLCRSSSMCLLSRSPGRSSRRLVVVNRPSAPGLCAPIAGARVLLLP